MKICKLFLITLLVIILSACQSDQRSVLIVQTNSGKDVQTEYSNFGGYSFNLKVPMDFEVKESPDEDNIMILTAENENVILEVKKSNKKLKDIKSLFADKDIISGENYKVDKTEVLKYAFIDNDRYHNVIYFENGGYLIEANFNCLTSFQSEWENVGKFILESLMFI